MSYPPPSGPYGYHQQPHHQQPYYPPPQQLPPPPPMPRYSKSVEKRRGLGGLANSTHFLLTIFTCGLWLMIWIPWWIFRVIVPRKRVTKTYYR